MQGGETASTESAAAVASEQNRPARSVCTFCSVPNRPTCCVMMQPWRDMLTAVYNDTVGHFECALHHGAACCKLGNQMYTVMQVVIDKAKSAIT